MDWNRITNLNEPCEQRTIGYVRRLGLRLMTTGGRASVLHSLFVGFGRIRCSVPIMNKVIKK